MDSEDQKMINEDEENGDPPKNAIRNPFRSLIKKEEKDKRRIRKARVIVRNISYKANEDSLREHFAKFGTIVDLNLLKRHDGRLVGCGFIQYEKTNDAAKAILNATNKEFLGRPVYVDWAVGKDEFIKKKSTQEQEIKTENDSEDEKKVNEIKQEEDVEMSDVDEKNDSDKDENEDEENSNSDESESDSENEFNGVKAEIQDDPDGVKQKKISNDVQEGCTIFIKNVPFDATNEALKKCCQKYGPVYYALINTDLLSGHSKGTGFVKFKKKESADLCLKGGEDFRLFDTLMEPHLALTKDEIKQRILAKSKQPADSRNLYLVKEGLIMANSKAADGVSASDMAKRHKLEQIKTQILKNLNRFVSRNRLSIHNLPLNYDDEKLRDMIINSTSLKPHECRVMREKMPSPGHPNGKSKGFGFMSFKTHQDALMALRKLNNNPKVFGNVNRPIVSFSIEDKSVHNIKLKRLQRSKENNPTFKKKKEILKEKKKKSKKNKDNLTKDKTDVKNEIVKFTTGTKPLTNKKVKSKKDNIEANEEFVGTSAKPGTFVRMRSAWKIQQQSKDHAKKVAEKKRNTKRTKEKNQHRIEKQGIVRMKKGKKNVEKDNFSALVENYKKSISKSLQSKLKTKRTKWYKE